MLNISRIFATLLMLTNPAFAENDPVVVELFTSQGCSSCPPADAFLHELASRDDVIALAMHVDYWDYIGWKDAFASPENTKRQRAYARVGGRKMIYTPQMIINGREHVVGNRPRDVMELIGKHRSRSFDIALNVVRTGDTVTIRATADKPLKDDLTVQLIRYTPRSTVDIRRGENAGRRLSYANIVTELKILATWDTGKPLALKTDVQGDAPIVVLVQHEGHGPVAAVARVR